MESIRHQVEIKAPIEDVFHAVATREGVSRWWTRHTEGTDGQGGTLAFWFGGDKPAATVEITELTPPERVVWHVVQGAEEWIDTRITFDLRHNGEKTFVTFSHDRWAEPVEFMHHCSTSWAYYLFSLQALLEEAAGIPWPDSMSKHLVVAR